MTAALGIPKPNRLIVGLLRVYYRVRNFRLRRGPAATTAVFTPGQAMHDVYPNGYQLDQLGPDAAS